MPRRPLMPSVATPTTAKLSEKPKEMQTPTMQPERPHSSLPEFDGRDADGLTGEAEDYAWPWHSG